jgi:hypothetical protein
MHPCARQDLALRCQQPHDPSADQIEQAIQLGP